MIAGGTKHCPSALVMSHAVTQNGAFSPVVVRKIRWSFDDVSTLVLPSTFRVEPNLVCVPHLIRVRFGAVENTRGLMSFIHFVMRRNISLVDSPCLAAARRSGRSEAFLKDVLRVDNARFFQFFPHFAFSRRSRFLGSFSFSANAWHNLLASPDTRRLVNPFPLVCCNVGLFD